MDLNYSSFLVIGIVIKNYVVSLSGIPTFKDRLSLHLFSDYLLGLLFEKNLMIHQKNLQANQHLHHGNQLIYWSMGSFFTDSFSFYRLWLTKMFTKVRFMLQMQLFSLIYHNLQQAQFAQASSRNWQYPKVFLYFWLFYLIFHNYPQGN